MFTLDQAALILQNYGYYLLFPITVIEGPIITILAGFLTSIGYLNAYIAYIVVVAGDLAGDALYYLLGRYGRDNWLKKWGKYVGITAENVKKLEDHYIEHAGKTLLAGKVLHGIGGVFLVSAGASRMPFWKFVWYNFLGSAPKSLMLMAAGYYFGKYLVKIDSILDAVALIVIVVTLAAIAYYFYGRNKVKWK